MEEEETGIAVDRHHDEGLRLDIVAAARGDQGLGLDPGTADDEGTLDRAQALPAEINKFRRQKEREIPFILIDLRRPCEKLKRLNRSITTRPFQLQRHHLPLPRRFPERIKNGLCSVFVDLRVRTSDLGADPRSPRESIN